MRIPDYQVTGDGSVTVYLLPEDFSFDVVAEAGARLIRGAEFAVVSGSGHYPWAENPAEFNPILFSFLGRHLPA